MLITEDTIQRILQDYDKGTLDPEVFLDQHLSDHEALFRYLHSGILDPLPDPDRDYFFFIISVVLHSLHTKMDSSKIPEADIIVELEEQNWGVFNDQKGTFRKKLDPFFKDCPEEDLLSFIEDSLAVEEGEDLSLASRELIFITAKTIIDSYLT